MKKRASLPGALAREFIRAAVHLPGLRNGGLFTFGAKCASVSRWKAPKGCELSRFDIDGMPAELLAKGHAGPPDRAVLQLHGGAYLMGLLDMYRSFARRYMELGGGVPVLTIDYRIAPAHHYPAALKDALKAWDWLMNRGVRPENIVVAGDSAGGNLALALTLRLRDEGRALPGALVLMSPWADMTGEGESRRVNFRKDPMFGSSAGSEADEKRKPGNPYAQGADLRDPCLSPVLADYRGFPPMLIQVGGWEMLLSEARTVAQRAREAGVEAVLSEYPGMFHVFQMLGGLIPESRRAWREAGEFIRSVYR